MHYDCSGVSLCDWRTISCTLIALVLARYLMHSNALVLTNVTLNVLRMLLCLSLSYFMLWTMIALVSACVICHALWLLWCVPVYYVVRCGYSCVCKCKQYDLLSTCSGVVMSLCVLYDCSSVCMLVCKCNQYVMHPDCSGVGMYFVVLYDCSRVCLLTMLYDQIALALACALHGALGMPLCWLAYTLHTRGLLWCLHV